MRKTILLATLFLLVLSVPMGCQTQETKEQPKEEPSTSEPAKPSDEKPKKEASVEIVDFEFNPDSLEIEKGGKVIWTNNDSAAHTATADEGEFDSGQLSQGQEYTKTFDKAGTFEYHCENHPSMAATVVVK